MPTSAGLNAAGYNLIRLLTVFHIMYIFTYSGRTNIVMNITSKILVFTIFWIKLLVKLAKFPTCTRVRESVTLCWVVTLNELGLFVCTKCTVSLNLNGYLSLC
jgi:hypothetical protein